MTDQQQQPTTSQPGETRVNTATVVAATVLVVMLFASAVTLGLAGWDGTQIAGLLTAVAGIGSTVVLLLDKVVTVQRVNAGQTEQLQTIERRTNGELDQRIKDGAEAAARAAAEAVLARVMNAPTAAYPVIQPRQPVTAVETTRTGE